MNWKSKGAFVAIGVLLAALLAVICSGRLDWQELPRALERMPRGPLLAIVAVAPLLGFSISVVYLVVGAVFGGAVGLAVVGGITALHLLGSHWIGRSFLRTPVQRFLARRRHRLPQLIEGEETALALTTVLLPGLPYFVRNYLLAVSALPLRSYFWICWPVYVVRSVFVIYLGDAGGDLTFRQAGLLGAIFVVKLAICAALIAWLRARHRARQPAAVDSSEAARNGSTAPRSVGACRSTRKAAVCRK